MEYVVVKLADVVAWFGRLFVREQHNQQCELFLGTAIARHRARQAAKVTAAHLPQRLSRAKWTRWTDSRDLRC
jgi:hypothetical protein